MRFPYLVSEIGSCFKTIKDCLDAIEISAELGCSAVKFQYATWDSLYSIDNPDKDGFNKNFIRAEWLPSLSKKAWEHDIEFMCSVFDVEHIKLVDYFVDAHKLASIESEDELLLKQMIRKNKHVIVSVGGKSAEKIDRIESLLSNSINPYSLLYSIVSYPTLNPLIGNVRYLRDKYRSTMCSIGISDHTKEIDHLIQNADCLDLIEKHFNPLDIRDRPDTGHSLNIKDMKKLVKGYLLNKQDHLMFSHENSLSEKHRRVLAAKQYIEKGEKFSPKNVGSCRLMDLNPSALCPTWNNMLGLFNKNASKSYKKGDPIHD